MVDGIEEVWGTDERTDLETMDCVWVDHNFAGGLHAVNGRRTNKTILYVGS